MTVLNRVKICKLTIAMKEQKKFSESIGLKDKTQIKNTSNEKVRKAK